MFSKNLIHSQKALVGACMQILNLLTIQHHITAKDNFFYMCYKNIILGEKNSIASSHSSKLSVSTVLITSYGWYEAMLSANLTYYSSLMDLVLRGSLVFHCRYINTVSVGRDATGKRRPETISGLRKTNRCHISRQNGHQLALCQLITQPKQSEFILK